MYLPFFARFRRFRHLFRADWNTSCYSVGLKGVNMRTSENVRELGLYASSCCGEELIFDKGDCFMRCPKCERLCEWELLEVLVPYEQFESLTGQAA
jgi:hypothetical protein